MRKINSVIFLGIMFLIMSACGGNDLNANEVIAAFEEEGLEVENKREMTNEEFGLGPNKAETAEMFTTPFVCEDCNVRVMSYDKEKDLDQMKEYYEVMGEEAAFLFSWTIKHKNILVQLNGDMEEEDYEKYKEVVEGL